MGEKRADENFAIVSLLQSTLEERGPRAVLDALTLASVRSGDRRKLSAREWWPQPVSAAEVETIKKAIVQSAHDHQIADPGAVPVALVETLAQIIADCAKAEGLHAAILNLIPSLVAEAERQLMPQGEV